MSNFVTTYFGLRVIVWRIKTASHPYPWRFSIRWKDGKERHYVGIPNQCETRGQALLKAYQKCKKLSSDGDGL
jgi:hypothetical protein